MAVLSNMGMAVRSVVVDVLVVVVAAGGAMVYQVNITPLVDATGAPAPLVDATGALAPLVDAMGALALDVLVLVLGSST